MSETWLCPNCWERWGVDQYCPPCGPRPPIGLYRHPPVHPDTGEISAMPPGILMGEMRHCDVPDRFNQPKCTAIMNDHGWIDDYSGDGVTVCPPWGWSGPHG